jgi:hypothetical protein
VLVRALQRDLRSLGYLRSSIDGTYGTGTINAVRSLQFDLLHNDGASRANDGTASVAITAFNVDPDRGDLCVQGVNGVVDERTAGCIDRLLNDERVAKIPDAVDPAEVNRQALRTIASLPSTVAPAPFVVAIVMQESGAQHYRVPGKDDDRFVVVGLDRGDAANPDHITSRGYGIGQYTLFHHPPRADEIDGFIVDPVNNVQRTFALLRAKFDRFVVGPSDHGDDRRVEHPLLPLRLCQYAPSDSRYMLDCRNCAAKVRKVNIERGTPAYSGATLTYQPDQYYPSANYFGVPDRAEFLCDWPYAVRRYNGSGNDSFHYQTRVLSNLLKLP